MIVYKVFINKDFELDFAITKDGTKNVGGHVFDDVNNPTFYDTEDEAIEAVARTDASPTIRRNGNEVTVTFNAAYAVSENIDENGKRISKRRTIISNVPSIEKLEAFLSETYK